MTSAFTQRINFNALTQLSLVRIIVLIGFAAAVIIAPKLWSSDRIYPVAPLFDFLNFPHDLSWILLASIVLAVILLRYRFVLVLPIAVLVVGIVLDQSRLQPWVYQYLFVLIALCTTSRLATDEYKQRTINIVRIILICIYFWAGIQKVNLQFFTDTLPWLMEPFTTLLPQQLHLLLVPIGLAVPFVEIATGVCLLVPRLRNYGVFLSILTHIIILLVIGPLGHNWNSVVWPWNIVMMCLTFILFTNQPKFDLDSVIADVFKYKLTAAIALLFAFMPSLSLLGWWDSYLSFSLYSGNTYQAVIKMDAETVKLLPPQLADLAQENNQSYALKLMDWSMTELNVPPYPEVRIFETVFRKFCQFTQQNAKSEMVVFGRLFFWFPEQNRTYTCVSMK